MGNIINNNILLGVLLITLGVLFTFFQQEVKKIDDTINNALLGSLWVANYSREAFLLSKVVYTVVGISLMVMGAGLIVNIIH